MNKESLTGISFLSIKEEEDITGGAGLELALAIYATTLAAAYGLGCYHGVQDRKANKR